MADGVTVGEVERVLSRYGVSLSWSLPPVDGYFAPHDSPYTRPAHVISLHISEDGLVQMIADLKRAHNA